MSANLEIRSCKFVSFSGIDGAGKSTQIEALCARLEEAGLRVLQLRFWDDVARFTRIRESAGHALFQGDRGVGTPAAPIHRRDKNVRWPLMTGVRLVLYLIDAISLRLAIRKALLSGADVVICDRYIYDELANLKLGALASRAYVGLIMKLVAKPHISYLLDADPVQARARKPEYPLEFLCTNRASYLALSRVVGMTVIAPMSIQDAQQDVLRHALEELAFEAIPTEKGERIAGY